MNNYEFVLADRMRAEQFSLLGRTRRLFENFDICTDEKGITWAVRRVGCHAFAVTWLGSGWVFDPFAQQSRAEELTRARKAMFETDQERHAKELSAVVRRLRLGPHTRRLLWAVHHAVTATRSSVVRLADRWLAVAVWGLRAAPPAHWRQVLRDGLGTLTWLHVAECGEGQQPKFGTETALLTHVGDTRETPEDDLCDDACPCKGGPLHHHYLVNVGRGFLGVLEQFASSDDGTGVRSYAFPARQSRDQGPTLRKVGKTGRLVSVYLPAEIGNPDACATITVPQHRLLQAIVRETTRETPRRRRDPSEFEIFEGNMVRDWRGKRRVSCQLLQPGTLHVGFNGNKLRKGLGYYLTSPGGWLAKAGYPVENVRAWLKDAEYLTTLLDLRFMALQRADSSFLNLEQMQTLAETPAGMARLAKMQVRIYTPADYALRWNSFFRWPLQMQEQPGSTSIKPGATVTKDLQRLRLTQRSLASGIGEDASFVSKLLRGDKPWPEELLKNARSWLTQQEAKRQREITPTGATAVRSDTPILAEAIKHLQRGWSIVPQLPGAKKPCIRWKEFQDRLPTAEEMGDWLRRWPQAGIALVLGPVSGVFAIDVDGPEGYSVLVGRLGSEPLAPKSLSGSRKPCRFHLFFRCPDVPTRAKATPWHPKLEFRGKGGIVVLPPSLHKSGNSYEWVPGQSIDDLALPELPPVIIAALLPSQRVVSPVAVPVNGIAASPSTLKFLSGNYADGPRWNERLFKAACDLAGRGMPMERAEALLLTGAQPWNEGEAECAQRTIRSAYNQAREPAIY